MKKAVFLDRDGILTKPLIINRKSFAPKKLKDFKLYYTSAKSVKRLKSAGYFVFVITNQPDVGKKLLSKIVLKKMHKILLKKTKIDEVYCCIHRQDENCYCRKPKPGLILQIAKKYKIDLKNSFVVGDRASDIEAGKRAKCRTIFVDKKYFEKRPNSQEISCLNLHQATNYILSKK